VRKLKNNGKGKTARFKPNLLITVVLSAVMALSLGIFINKIMEYNEIKKEKAVVKNSIESCKEDIGALEYEYDAPMDDKYIESVAKSKLNLINPDEIIVYNDNQ
jgi:cell division protein FtsB